MGATSVTGKGTGSADGYNKGSSHMTLGVDHLIGPRVVAAGSETLSGTTGTVEIPAQTGVYTDYVVFLQSNGSTYAYTAGMTSTWTFAITAGSGAVVSWVVVKKGL